MAARRVGSLRFATPMLPISGLDVVCVYPSIPGPTFFISLLGLFISTLSPFLMNSPEPAEVSIRVPIWR